MSVYDVNVPTASYERELEKIRKALSQIDENRDASEAKRKRDKESKMMEEQRRQQEHVARVTTRLEGEKDDWFPASKDFVCFLLLKISEKLKFWNGFFFLENFLVFHLQNHKKEHRLRNFCSFACSRVAFLRI